MPEITPMSTAKMMAKSINPSGVWVRDRRATPTLAKEAAALRQHVLPHHVDQHIPPTSAGTAPSNTSMAQMAIVAASAFLRGRLVKSVSPSVSRARFQTR